MRKFAATLAVTTIVCSFVQPANAATCPEGNSIAGSDLLKGIANYLFSQVTENLVSLNIVRLGDNSASARMMIGASMGYLLSAQQSELRPGSEQMACWQVVESSFEVKVNDILGESTLVGYKSMILGIGQATLRDNLPNLTARLDAIVPVFLMLDEDSWEDFDFE